MLTLQSWWTFVEVDIVLLWRTMAYCWVIHKRFKSFCLFQGIIVIDNSEKYCTTLFLGVGDWVCASAYAWPAGNVNNESLNMVCEACWGSLEVQCKCNVSTKRHGS